MLRQRDYSLLGAEGKRAVDMGLAAAEWYHTEVPRKDMKALMRRTDRFAIRDTALWIGGMVLFAGIGIWLWPSWWSAPFWLVYGVLYGSGGDSRWHESGHGTAFKTQWMNEALYQIGSFMVLRNPTAWRWSHIRHHTDTIIVGMDPEIAVMRPPAAAKVLMNFFAVPTAIEAFKRMFIHIATGRLHPEEACYVPESEHAKAVRDSWIWFAVYSVVIGSAIWWWTLLPLMVIGLPSIYGAWHYVLTGILQHAALADDVLDHRLNSRTFHTNPFSRFVYWNMNYHVEHHMFPMVPYHALPRLHAMIGEDLPEPDKSMWDAYKKVIPILLRQLKGEDVFLVRELKPSAQPYRAELHDLAAA